MIIIIKKSQLQSYLINLFNSEAINIDEKFQQSRTFKFLTIYAIILCANRLRKYFNQFVSVSFVSILYNCAGWQWRFHDIIVLHVHRLRYGHHYASPTGINPFIMPIRASIVSDRLLMLAN